MQTTQSKSGEQENLILAECKIVSFFKKYKVGSLAGRCGITKMKGVSPSELLIMLISLPFLGQNIFRAVVTNERCEFGKDVVYDFLGSCRFSWRRFLLQLALKITFFLDGLTSDDRECVLILDDTSIERPRSKKVELLARVYDHSEQRFLKGFRMLNLGWSDGASFVPLDFALLSSTDLCNRHQEADKTIDRRSCGAARRREAVTKSTALIAPMVKRALAAGFKARYLLMDSWFGMTAIISSLRAMVPVICMVKKTPADPEASRPRQGAGQRDGDHE